MTLKPGGDFGVLVGRIVVANNVKLQLGGDFLVDLAQEGEPLLMAMARGGVGKHLAGKVVQGAKSDHDSSPTPSSTPDPSFDARPLLSTPDPFFRRTPTGSAFLSRFTPRQNG